MKYNKLKAFTLAEVMVLLLTLSILMAAFAPVFTRRYSNVTTDEVWTFIAGDPNYNAYFDTPNKMYKNQAFIGLQPRDSANVDDLVKDGTNVPRYSKLVIGASHRLGSVSGTPPQQQMQFRYGSSAMGTLVATLFAGNKNMLLGGPFFSIKDTTDAANTSFGLGTLEGLTSGKNNTALGAYALNDVENGSDNTAIGYTAGATLRSGKQNTIIGTYAGANIKTNVDNNTLIGYKAGYSVSGNANTAIGNEALSADAGNANTAVGTNALKNATGKGNTAVGANALMNMKAGNYNTAIGYNSCNFIGHSSSSTISKVTCIGANSAKEDKSSTAGAAGLPTGDNVPDRVFLGTFPNDSTLTSNNQKPFAVLEVHNSINDPNDSLLPMPGGEESVIINGNLIVRGQPYFESRVFRAAQLDGKDYQDSAPKGLMMFRLHNNYRLNSGNGKVLGGYDGTYRNKASHEGCGGCKEHKFNNVRTGCICTAVGPSYGGDTSYANYTTNKVRYSSTSYDWYSTVTGSNGIGGCVSSGAYYTDKSTGSRVNLSYHPRGYKPKPQDFGSREVDNPQSHMGSDTQSCCPILSSDIRLKNVGEKFVAGLDEIKKINVYNYTFKNDINRLPQVGVIAQDLKAVFPNAVTKGDDGYYRIRWDEMLYAAVNAIKTLNSKIEAIATRIATDKERIAALKRDNAEMYAQLDKLVDELEVLEAKKK